jgi:hypothetical protein
MNLGNLFANSGFTLTPLARHNLGSSNQLIMLDTTYIELLGWEPGTKPQRAEIANQQIGLDALVFRTEDADTCYEQLKQQGFDVNPVQDLSRESEFMGTKVLVQFKTVRFTKQPIEGLRIYFCEHLNPEYVWQSNWLNHGNQLNRLKKITVTTPNALATSNIFAKVLNSNSGDINPKDDSIEIQLPNLTLSLLSDTQSKLSQILSACLVKTPPDPVDFIINKPFLADI